MNRFPMVWLPTACVWLCLFLTSGQAGEPTLLQCKQSGTWSDPNTWDAGRVPAGGDRVVIGKGRSVRYDVESAEVIRLVQIAGELDFARDRNTRLEAGLILVTPSEVPSEEGFDCHAPPVDADHGGAQPVLSIGRPGSPIPASCKAAIRLHYIEGMDKESCPAIVNCASRMEIHGSPLERTWVKLKVPAKQGSDSVVVSESVGGWKAGDAVIVTGTAMQRSRGGDEGRFLERSQTEQRRIKSIAAVDDSDSVTIVLDTPLTFDHYADDEFQGEVANLTRNVVVESADPDGVRAHTLYHHDSSGSISYAEFRHLGKKGLLGRYSLHFHLCGDTMRGSSVIGASIWDSDNRWLTIHGTDALVVRDCVGFKSVGHGYFLEDGTETNNILDHNLAALVLPGKPLPKQVVPFDLNRGAGFWWANSQNSFTRNCAVECAEYGYRFDCKQTDDYDPHRMIRQADGSEKSQDTRVMPFVRFQDNEAHSMRFFCLNLRGIARPVGGGLDLYGQNATLTKEAAEAMPDPSHPFWIRDFKAWEANWSVHLGTTGVFIDGLKSFRNDVAIWRSIMDRSGFRRLVSKEMRVNDIHNPLSMGLDGIKPDDADGEPSERRTNPFRGVSSFADTMPPVTVITSAIRDGSSIHIQGSVADSSDIKQVLVNDLPARSLRSSFAEWEMTLEAPINEPITLIAKAADVKGNVELSPHVVELPPVAKAKDGDDARSKSASLGVPGTITNAGVRFKAIRASRMLAR